jgi:hypothetical protein
MAQLAGVGNPESKESTMARKQAASVAALKHPDQRANIPTEELRDFVAEDGKAPHTRLLWRAPPPD